MLLVVRNNSARRRSVMPSARRAWLLSSVLALLASSTLAQAETCATSGTCGRGDAPECVQGVCRYSACDAGFFYDSDALTVR